MPASLFVSTDILGITWLYWRHGAFGLEIEHQPSKEKSAGEEIDAESFEDNKERQERNKKAMKGFELILHITLNISRQMKKIWQT